MVQKRYLLTCECGQSMRVSEAQIGRQGTCVRCGRTLDVVRDTLEPLNEPTSAGASNGPAIDDVSAEWNPGDLVLGLYEVQDILGEGGMGKVYKVHHRAWGMDLAVKSPRPAILQRRGGVTRFERECATWISLGLHPHIVTCFYVRRLGGIPRVFAEYVNGGSLWTLIRERRLYEGGSEAALVRMLDIAIQFAWGLQHAHAQGFVHQDVKPSNLLVSPGGVAKVCDFGLARALTPDENDDDDPRGMTRVYRSPEQADGLAITPQTDMWGWGLSVLEMFLGRHKWRNGEEAPLALRRYMSKEHPAPPEIPRMPYALAELLVRCFREAPAARPRDMAEIAGVLQGIYEEQTGAPYARRAPSPADALSDSLNNRAISLMDLGRSEDALQMWQEALRSDPQHPDSTYNVGLLEWRAGSITDEAFLFRLREIDRMHPGDPLGPYRVAQAHLERGDFASAAQLLEECDRAEPGRPEVTAALRTARERREASRSLLRTFTGHNDAVTAVAIGPEGQTLVSGSDDNTICVWDRDTGRCKKTLQGHTNSVRALCLHRKGQFVVSGGADKSVRVWHLGYEHRAPDVLEGHGGPIRAVSLSADGRTLASASEDKTVRLWNLEANACMTVLEGHTHWVTGAQLSADGRRVLSAGYDRTLRLWRTRTGECLRKINGHQAPIECLAMSADARFAVSGDERGILKVWLLPSGDCLRTIPAHEGAVRSVSMTADGRHALSGGRDGRVRLWEAATGRCLCTLEDGSEPVFAVGLDPDGRFALSGGRDRNVQLWRAECSGAACAAMLMVCRGVAGEAASTAVTAYQNAMAEARRAEDDGDAVAAAHFLRTARSQPGRRRAPQTMREWRKLYAHLPRTTLEGGWESLGFNAAVEPVNALRVSRDGRRALTLAGQNTLQLWNTETGACEQRFGGDVGPLRAVDLSEDGRIAAAGFWDVRVWNAETGEPVCSFDRQSDGVHALAISPDKTLVAAGGAEWLRLWHTQTRQCLWAVQGHAGDVTAATWSRDGCFLLTGGEDQVMVLWDVARCEAVRVLRTQGGPIRSVSLCDDGRFALAVGATRWGTAGRMTLWDLVTGRCIQRFEGHAGDAASASLSADGRHVISAGEDRTVKVWDAATGQCVLTMESHAAPLAGAGLAGDAGMAISADRAGAMKVWLLDWELADRAPAEWDNGALPYLRVFLARHTPYSFALPLQRAATEPEIKAALTRHGRPSWSSAELEEFLEYLGEVGYGWLRPESIRTRVARAASAWASPPRVYRSGFTSARGIARKLKDLLGR